MVVIYLYNYPHLKDLHLKSDIFMMYVYCQECALWVLLIDLLSQCIEEEEEEHLRIQKHLDAIDSQRHELENTMKSTSKVFTKLEEMYPLDLEVCFYSVIICYINMCSK